MTKKWLRDPLKGVALVYAFLALIWPHVFLPMLLIVGLLMFTWNWSSEKFDNFLTKFPKLGVAFVTLFSLGFAAFAFIDLPLKLIEAWKSGEIEAVRRWRQNPIFTVSENPIGYWMTFGLEVLCLLGFAGFPLFLVYIRWVTRNISIKPRRQPFDRGPPTESVHENASETRLIVSSKAITRLQQAPTPDPPLSGRGK